MPASSARITFIYNHMRELKKVLRILVLTFLVLLALSGIGIIGSLYSNNRERYLNKKITIERVDKKDSVNEDQLTDHIQIK